MARISTYVVDGTIVDGDKVIGSDANNDMVTKNYTIGDLVAYFAVSIGDYLVPYNNATDDVDLGPYSLFATNLSISGTFTADGTTGLVGQVLTSQGSGSPAVWAYNIGSQDLQDVLNNGNTGSRNILLNDNLGSTIKIDVESNILSSTGIQLYDVASTNTSYWVTNEIGLQDGLQTFTQQIDRTIYSNGTNNINIIANNYNNQTFLYPNYGGAFVMSVNGVFADMSGNVLITPGTGGIGTVTSVNTSAPLTGGPITSSGTIGITQSGTSSNGYLSSTDWNTFNAKQDTITLTTIGTSGAATFVGNTLNIPQYSGGGGSGTVTSVQLSAGTGISLSGTNPITTSGIITVTNSAPDQIVSISSGTGIGVSGTYPNFTITNTSPSIGGTILHGTASGTDTYTATIVGPSSYADGDAYLIRFTNGNTTGCTLNINGLGAIPLYRNNDGPLIGGDIWAGGEMLCVYNSTTTTFQCIGTSPNSLYAYVTNDDSVTLTKGMPVYAFSGTGDRMTVKRANNTLDSTSAQTVGLVYSSSIAANQKGFIIIQGLLDGLNILPTSTWSDGSPVYLGATAGSITATKPYAPNHLVYLGFVTTASNGSSGRMYVRVQNGYELDELHNVQAQSPTLKDTLWYDSTVSPGQWKTASISTILGYTPQAQLTNPVTGTGTNNELAYFNTTGSTISSLTTATYPSLTELSYVKGVTSAIQTQISALPNDWIPASAYQALGSSIKSVSLSCLSLTNLTTSGALTNQQIRFFAVYLAKAQTITGVKWMQLTAGNYTANNYNGLGLYSYSGGTLTLVASSTNDGNIWKVSSTNTFQSKAFSSTYAAAAGVYYVGALYCSSAQTTAPGIYAAVTGNATYDFTSVISSTLNAQTSLPSTQLSSGLSVSTGNLGFWLY